jgi:hypothetical protein
MDVFFLMVSIYIYKTEGMRINRNDLFNKQHIGT